MGTDVEVLLTQTVENLGEPGQIVRVAAGYARNYLLPQGIAVEPTPHNVRRFEKVRLAREAELRSREEKAQALKEQLDGLELVFKRQAHRGKLYGSVRWEDLIEAIAERTGHELERDRIKLDAPIEEIGRFPVELALYKDITARVEVVVEEESQEEDPSE